MGGAIEDQSPGKLAGRCKQRVAASAILPRGFTDSARIAERTYQHEPEMSAYCSDPVPKTGRSQIMHRRSKLCVGAVLDRIGRMLQRKYLKVKAQAFQAEKFLENEGLGKLGEGLGEDGKLVCPRLAFLLFCRVGPFHWPCGRACLQHRLAKARPHAYALVLMP